MGKIRKSIVSRYASMYRAHAYEVQRARKEAYAEALEIVQKTSNTVAAERTLTVLMQGAEHEMNSIYA